jgi:hypothetical protein
VVLLISKTQNRKCEKGEFHQIAKRDLEDTISLLLNFPWERERHLASVELTCPSVTVEHPSGTYLKVGTYFSGKFSLYYLGSNSKVYFKPASTLLEASEEVERFFRQEGILTEFSAYGFVVRPSAHFRTNPFEYTLGRKANKNFFKGARFSVFIALLFCLQLFFMPLTASSIIFLTVILILVVLSYSPLIYLYFNYHDFDEGRYLQISAGKDSFTFDLGNDTTVYHKEDIRAITAEGRRTRRNPWSNCRVFTISFRYGDQIRFTSLLIPESEFRRKFPDHVIQDVHSFFPKV